MVALIMSGGPTDRDSQMALIRTSDVDAIVDFLFWGEPHPDVVEALATHRSGEIRNALASCDSASETVLAILIEDPASQESAARNKSLPVDLQRRALDFPNVHEDLASNENLDPGILHELLDGSPQVRSALAYRSDLDETALERLVEDPELSVRVALADSANSPKWVVERLMVDASVEVIAAIAANIDSAGVGSFATHPEERVRSAVASNENATTQHQVLLAGDSSHWVRLTLANSWSLDPDAAVVLASDPDETIRHSLASNPALHGVAREKIAHDTSEKVRSTLAEQYGLPKDVQRLLVHDESDLVKLNLSRNESLNFETYSILATDDLFAPGLASCSHLPVSEQERYAALSVAVRENLVLNPNLDDAVRDQILLLGERSVAQRAVQNAHLHWTPLIPADLALRYNSDYVRSYALSQDVDMEAWESLVGSWQRSLVDLAEAVKLTGGSFPSR